MKRMICSLIITLFVTGVILTACQSSTTKREKAKVEEIPDTVIYIDQDKLTLSDSIKQFKHQSEKQILLNEKNIVLFKTEAANEKESDRIKDAEKIAELELRNNDLVIRLDNYYDESQEQWDSFKVEYNEDMDDLEDAFEGLTIENKK